MNRQDLIRRAWLNGSLRYKLRPCQVPIYEAIHGILGRPGDLTFALNIARRYGKCLRKGTLVKTPTGSIPIEELQIGDTVYGYNKDGNIKPCKVIDTHYQGIKETIELKHSNRSLVWATEEHKFLTHYSNRSGKNKNVREQKTVAECIKRNYNHITLAEEYCPIPGGRKSVTEAYALGALLGDGCSREAGVKFSTGDFEIVQGIAESLSCEHVKKSKGNNYTWEINRSFNYRGLKNEIPHYRDWLDKRYAHEKICDLETIRTWNRKSQLEFIAGLIDSDGSVSKTRDGRLAIQLSMQAKKVLDVVAAILMDLFQAPVTWGKDNREKLINGPVWKLSILNNKFSKRILRELPTRVPRKQWKPEYEKCEERNSNPNYVGFKVGNRIKDHCYDITIDNDTNLFLLANGLITHNSFCKLLVATELSLRNPHFLTRIAAITQKDIEKTIHPLMRQILEDCPPELTPRWMVSRGCYVFQNGSEIHVAGTDKDGGKHLRGQRADFAIVDEAGHCSNLHSVVYDILMPQTLDTGGKLILGSTPPETPDHDWTYIFRECEAKGNSLTFTVYNNTHLDPETIEIYKKASGGENSTTWRREYLCEFVIEEERALCIEWSDDYVVEPEPGEFDKFWHRYEAMDLGVRDFTVVLFAHYNFQEARLYIEDEVVLKNKDVTTQNIRDGILAKEKEIWPEYQIYKRIADNNNLILLQDLATFQAFSEENGVAFLPTSKDNLEAMVNEVRLWVGSGRIRVHPRCKQLLGCLKYGIWNKTRKNFDRSKEYGHYDAFAALMYLIRNVSVYHNPIPPHYGIAREDHYIEDSFPDSNNARAIKKLFSPPPKFHSRSIVNAR